MCQIMKKLLKFKKNIFFTIKKLKMKTKKYVLSKISIFFYFRSKKQDRLNSYWPNMNDQKTNISNGNLIPKVKKKINLAIIMKKRI